MVEVLSGIKKLLAEYGIKYCDLRFSERDSVILRKWKDGYEIEAREEHLIYQLRAVEDDVVSALRVLVDVLKCVKTRSGKLLAGYYDGCIMMWMCGIEYIKWLGAEKMVSDIKGEVV